MRQGKLHFKTHPTCTISIDQTLYRPLLCQSPNKIVSCTLKLPSPAPSLSCADRGESPRTACPLPMQCPEQMSCTWAAHSFHLGNPSSTTYGSIWYPEHRHGILWPRNFHAIGTSIEAFTIYNNSSSCSQQQVEHQHCLFCLLPKSSPPITV